METAQSLESPAPAAPAAPVCSVCGKNFGSRNAIFRHLKDKTSPCSKTYDILPKAIKAVLVVGYVGRSRDKQQQEQQQQEEEEVYGNGEEEEEEENGDVKLTDAAASPSAAKKKNDADVDESLPAEEIGGRIWASQAILEMIRKTTPAEMKSNPACMEQLRVIATSSIQKVHAKCMRLPEQVHAVGDVVLITTFRGPEESNVWLEELRANSPKGLIVHNVVYPDPTFHPEGNCTHRRYEYLIPYSAIAEEGEEEPKFLSDNGEGMSLRMNRLVLPERALQRCRQFKTVLLQFGDMRRRRFHNYGKNLIPGAELVLRKITRVFHSGECIVDGRLFLSICVSGDCFLAEQVQSIIGVSVAIIRGLLPVSFIEESLRVDRIIPVPVAPSELFWLDECNFPFYETKHNIAIRIKGARVGNRGAEEYASVLETLFTPDAPTDRPLTPAESVGYWRRDLMEEIARIEMREHYVDDWVKNILPGQAAKCQKQLDIMRSFTSSLSSKQQKQQEEHRRRMEEGDAAEGDGDEDTPRRRKLRGGAGGGAGAKKGDTPKGGTPRALPPCPPEYERVLDLLRQADKSGLWPDSTTARKKVMEPTTRLVAGEGGTFSFGSMPPPFSRPRTNEVFPELMKAAFELEKALMPHRKPSSTIAVNRHAQFKPHYDSGHGAGQSDSMLVGLGDYWGGETVVEGACHDIRYNPIEFNGWMMRHWTLPFTGERYSLVFFTPLGCENMSGLSLVEERERKLQEQQQQEQQQQ